MAAFNLPDIYGRNYLINFDAVKYIQVSDNEERGDLIITFTDKTIQTIPVGLDREALSIRSNKSAGLLARSVLLVKINCGGNAYG